MKVSITWDFSDAQRVEIRRQVNDGIGSRKADRHTLRDWMREKLINAEIQLSDEIAERGTETVED